MEMSQGIYFWYHILLEITFARENVKKPLFLLEEYWKPSKYNFELKMLRLHENHVKTNF